MREKFNFLLMDFLMNFWGFGLFYQSGENGMGGSVNLKINFSRQTKLLPLVLTSPGNTFVLGSDKMHVAREPGQ